MLLREHRREPKGLADLLTWGALVAPGVVVNKDGSFLGGWSYRGPDVDSATSGELAVLSRHINAALLTLGSDWMLQADAVRTPAAHYPPPGAFPDAVTALIDEERREQYETAGRNHETRYYLVLTHMPPPEAASRATLWFIEGEEKRAVDWREQLGLFEKRLDDFEDLLGNQLGLERLDSEELLRHLHFCLAGLDHPVRLPDPPCYLDALLADQDFYGGFSPRIGRHRIAPIGLTGLPSSSRPGILAFLDRQPLGYRFSSRWLPLDPEAAGRHIRRYRMKWWQKRRGMTGLVAEILSPQGRRRQVFPNKDAMRMARDADAAMAHAASSEVRYGYYTPALVLMGEDGPALDEAIRLALKELRNRGFGARLEEVNAIETYLGSLPGHGHPNVRRPLVSTRNLADLLPATSVWPGLASSPCPTFPARSPALLWAATSGSTPFRLNLHVSDVGHTLVVGPTGSGKSTLLGLIQAQWFRYSGAQVFAFDKGSSAMPLARAAGGHHYDIAAEGIDSLSFCPLAGIADGHERAWAAEWLAILFDLQGIAVTPGHRAAIHRALELLAGTEQPTLTDLEIRLQDIELRQALRPYTLKGNLGTLLDAQEDGLVDGRFQVFEMGQLMELREKVVVPVLLYLFHRIEQRLDGRPSLIVIDEAWTFLMHGLFADRIQAWLKELRKKNAAVVFATQSLADIHRSEKRYVIYESCPTKIFLPNPEAAAEHGAVLYREIGLNEREIQIVASAMPKRDYYYTSSLGRRLIDLTLGPVALAFVGAGDKESLRRVREFEAEHGREWSRAWLRGRGLDAWADRLPRSEAGSMPEIVAITEPKEVTA
jgi:type IV secretion system protein VirB4